MFSEASRISILSLTRWVGDATKEWGRRQVGGGTRMVQEVGRKRNKEWCRKWVGSGTRNGAGGW